MEKRLLPKNRRLAKQPAGKEKGPSAMQDVLFAKPSREDSEVIEGISIDFHIVSDRKRALPDSAIDPIIDRATEVIGDRQEAMRWLGAPVRGLDFATPISLLATEDGQMRVKDILGQMEHGIW